MDQIGNCLGDEEQRSDDEEEHLFSAGDDVSKPGVVVAG